MRKLMWFSIGFFTASALCAYILPEDDVLPLMLVLGLFGLSASLFRKWRETLPMVLFFLGYVFGSAWYLEHHNLYLHPVSQLDGTTADLIVEATDYSFETSAGIRVDGVITISGKTYRTTVKLDSKEEIVPGDRIYGNFFLRYTSPDSPGDATYHRGNGIYLLLYEQSVAVVLPGNQESLRYMPARLRHQINDIIECYFPEDTAAFAQALLLGNTTELTYEQDTYLKLSGIRHVIAVSGLHVSILFTMVSCLTLKRRWLKALIGIPVLLLFAAVAGFTPSVTRACVMCILMLTSEMFFREYDGATALSFSVLVMLLVNPLVVTSVAFQLSVGSVAGIFLFQNSVHGWLLSKLGNTKGKTLGAKIKRWFAASVSVSLSAMSLTTPLCAWYFGTISLVSILTNLLTLWVISFIFYAIIGVCGLSLIWSSGAILLARVCSIPIRYVLLVSRLLGGLPFAAVYSCSIYIVIWLGYCYALLGAMLLQRKRRPGICACLASIGLWIAILLSWMEPHSDAFRMTVLDVGQGQSILLQSDERNILVDCGGDSASKTADIIAHTLLSQGITNLDGIILTHTDEDHAGALDYLLTRVKATTIYYPESERRLLHAQAVMPGEKRIISMGDGELSIFGPITCAGGNENSLCILFESENCAILITGDRSGFGERMLMRYEDLPKVDALVAGHHGSAESTCTELLEEIRPQAVIISAGKDNSYNLPNAELIRRLEQYGCMVLRTDRNGTIIFRR